MERPGYIYKITSPTKRVYIGQTLNYKKRFREYKSLKCNEQPRIYHSLKKYGSNKHSFEIITECDQTELNKWERYYQDLYSACGNRGLNCKFTGYEERSGSMSEETKVKMSLASLGKPKSKEHCENIRLSRIGVKHHLFGKNHSETTIKKMSINRTGGKHCQAKKVIDTKTGIVYPSTKEAADFFKIKRSTLIARLSGQNKNKTSLIYA